MQLVLIVENCVHRSMMLIHYRRFLRFIVTSIMNQHHRPVYTVFNNNYPLMVGQHILTKKMTHAQELNQIPSTNGIPTLLAPPPLPSAVLRNLPPNHYYGISCNHHPNLNNAHAIENINQNQHTHNQPYNVQANYPVGINNNEFRAFI